MTRWIPKFGMILILNTKSNFMKKIFSIFVILLAFTSVLKAQTAKEIWNANQLMETKTLADLIQNNKVKNTLILSIGPDAVIKGSQNMGPANEPQNLEKFKVYLKNVKKDKQVVIYCGCCPFDRCPNIRPAFKVLKEMGFKNAKLLNIPQNIKTDWLDKDYPSED